MRLERLEPYDILGDAAQREVVEAVVDGLGLDRLDVLLNEQSLVQQPCVHLVHRILLSDFVATLEGLLDLLAHEVAHLPEVLVQQRDLPDGHLHIRLRALGA